MATSGNGGASQGNTPGNEMKLFEDAGFYIKVSFAWLDQSKHIWLCNEETIFIYNTDTGEVTLSLIHISASVSSDLRSQCT